MDLAAEEAGSQSNAPPGLITVMVTTFLGVSCVNDVALSGLDEETDPALRQRCRDSLAGLSIGGPSRAYEFYAKSATYPDGTPVGITRVIVMPATGDGHVDVYIAGPSGAVSVEAVAAVQASFDANVTPYGFDATAISATNLSITAFSETWLPASLSVTTDAAKNAVLKALQDYVQTVPIGGVLIPPTSGRVYASMLLGEITNAIPGTLRAQIFAADFIVATGEVPIWTGSIADVAVHQVT
jgi:phage-related baseplate assembly protein